MKNLLVLTSALFLACAAIPAHADTVTYAVSVNTSSQAGNGGYIDLEFNAGSFPSQDITATVTGFSGATLNSADPFNDAIGTTGSLPGDVAFDNQTGNDYFEALTFGNNISFLVTLSGDGLSTAGSSTNDAGTNFQLSFFDPTISSFLFSNDPNGTAALIEVAADGTPSIETQPGTTVAPTPEPATLSLLGLGGVLIGVARRWRPRAA
jgi:hypothetical protein